MAATRPRPSSVPSGGPPPPEVVAGAAPTGRGLADAAGMAAGVLPGSVVTGEAALGGRVAPGEDVELEVATATSDAVGDGTGVGWAVGRGVAAPAVGFGVGAGGAGVGTAVAVGFAVGLGVGFAVGFGVAGSAGGAMPGGGDAPPGDPSSVNDQPSTLPGGGLRVLPPCWLVTQEPPRSACQYDQYALAGGVLRHGSWDAFGLPSMRHRKPGTFWTSTRSNPAAWSALKPLAGDPGAQRTTTPPPRAW